MTLAFTRQAMDDGLPVASQLVLISPCTDYSLANPELHAAAKADPWLDIPGVEEMARLVCPDLDTKDPRLSPMYSELKGLPPMWICAGGVDLLTPDTKKFVALAREKGNNIEFFFGDGMMHIWPVLPIPEATVAINKMTGWLLKTLE